jgi:hypothetical protein
MIQRHELEKVILKKNSVLITAVLDRLRGSITAMSLDELSSLTNTHGEVPRSPYKVPLLHHTYTLPYGYFISP